jgi:CRP-like cAMP-binding protein
MIKIKEMLILIYAWLKGKMMMIRMLQNSFTAKRNNWEIYKDCFKEITVSSKTVLLKEGEVPKNIFFVKKGCLRLAFNKNGKDVTFQFFFENEPVASIESLKKGAPSPCYIESIEPAELYVLKKKDFERIVAEVPQIKEAMFDLIYRRFGHYSKLFLSYIKNTPKERYIELLQTEPRLIQRVPQHYIASYLGITPVSLSRIRKKVMVERINK